MNICAINKPSEETLAGQLILFGGEQFAEQVDELVLVNEREMRVEDELLDGQVTIEQADRRVLVERPSVVLLHI